MEFTKQEADQVADIVDEIVRIKNTLDSHKALYERLDDLTLELLDAGVQVDQTLSTKSQAFLTVVDNFADQNTIYRALPAKRFDIKLETPEEFKKRRLKEEKARGR
jgi:hypothetical protein